MYSVYALVDPRDDSIRYIGMTKNAIDRMARHLRADEGSAEKVAWIKELTWFSLMPLYWELESVNTFGDAREREIYWINYCLSGGEPLTNKEAPTTISTQGRKSTREKFLAELEQYQKTGINPWKSARKMKHYAKKKYGIVV